MDFLTFRDLLVCYVRIAARAAGWSVVGVKVARTGSTYVDLDRGGERCEVRIADHRTVDRRSRMFTIVHGSVGKIHSLGAFLASGRWR